MLSETPNAQLKIKSTRADNNKQSRETMRIVRRKLEQQYDKRDCDMVLENIVSWQKYNMMIKNDSFETKRKAPNCVAMIGVKQ